MNPGDRVTTEGVGCVGTVQEVWPYSARVLWDDDAECCEPIADLTVQAPAPVPTPDGEGQ